MVGCKVGGTGNDDEIMDDYCGEKKHSYVIH